MTSVFRHVIVLMLEKAVITGKITYSKPVDKFGIELFCVFVKIYFKFLYVRGGKVKFRCVVAF